MAHRPPGRPKASDPRDIKITVRLTEREADLLQRLAQEDSLSKALRHALDRYIGSMGCIFHGCLPPSPWEGCHSVHVKAATQSTGCLPLSPREGCHVDQGKVATHSRRSLPLSERSDAGRYIVILRSLLLSTSPAVSA
jgi:hypothetical protein